MRGTSSRQFLLNFIYSLFVCFPLQAQQVKHLEGVSERVTSEALTKTNTTIWIQNTAKDTVLFVYLNPFSDLIRVAIPPDQSTELKRSIQYGSPTLITGMARITCCNQWIL